MQVKLIKHLRIGPGASLRDTWMEIICDLPFLPSVGMLIGDGEEVEFIVKEVSYNFKTGIVTCYDESERPEDEMEERVKELQEQGWRLQDWNKR